LTEAYEQVAELELVNRARAGDEAAFAEIVRRFSPRVFRFASRFFRQRSLVEEAAQDVFLKAFTQLDSFAGQGSFEGWLTRITTTTCLNLLRGAQRRPEASVSDLSTEEADWLAEHLADERQPSAEQQLIAVELADRVLATLTPDDRLILLLLDGEGASIKEAVAATGWSEAKVKVQAHRARRRMREALERVLAKP
jgi:RNA polymerase sigma-70 factor (ECF subfamily)